MARILLQTIVLVLAVVLPAWAQQSAQTEWLEMREGATEQNLGAEVGQVTALENGAVYRVEVILPASTPRIEEVLVIGKRDSDEIPLLANYKVEVINDFDQGRRGIIIYLGRAQRFALRINYQQDNRWQP